MNLSFSYRFEAAHRFINPSTKCSTPHGHTWWVHLTLEHEDNLALNPQNFAEDFTNLKTKWKNYIDEEMDHYFFLNSKDPLKKELLKITPNSRIKCTEGDPTTEALALILFNIAWGFFEDHAFIKPKCLKLQETPTNSVEVYNRFKELKFI